MKMKQTECSETLAYKIQTPGNYPEESIQLTEFSLHIRSSSPAASLKTVIICLHAFLFLSCPFLLGIGCWLSYSYIVLL
jgi:hypothetical protein